jgi:hypothetical protein
MALPSIVRVPSAAIRVPPLTIRVPSSTVLVPPVTVRVPLSTVRVPPPTVRVPPLTAEKALARRGVDRGGHRSRHLDLHAYPIVGANYRGL